MKIDQTNRLNVLSAPWSVRSATYPMNGRFHVLDSEQSCVSATYTETDATIISLVPELVDELTEAMYEYCFTCMEQNDIRIMDSREVIEKGCPKHEGECFVQRWMKTLKKIQDAIKEGAKQA